MSIPNFTADRSLKKVNIGLYSVNSITILSDSRKEIQPQMLDYCYTCATYGHGCRGCHCNSPCYLVAHMGCVCEAPDGSDVPL